MLQWLPGTSCKILGYSLPGMQRSQATLAIVLGLPLLLLLVVLLRFLKAVTVLIHQQTQYAEG
jgi:hypothetical protein